MNARLWWIPACEKAYQEFKLTPKYAKLMVSDEDIRAIFDIAFNHGIIANARNSNPT